MMTKRLRCWLQFWLACSVVAILCTSFGFGQTVTGAITGQVTDPSGAVVVGAHVTAENTATAVKTPTQTNGSGIYTIRFLPIGSYTVTIEAQGLTTQKVPPFALEIDRTAKINISLEIASSTSVEVH